VHKRRKRLEAIEHRLKVLECPHKNVDFFQDVYWRKTCRSCGKILERYDTIGEYLIAQRENELKIGEERVSWIDARIKALGKERND